MNLDKLTTILKDQPKYRFKQIDEAIFSELITSWDEATSLPLKLREELKKNVSLDIDAEIIESNDKRTVKALITLSDGLKIETVLMKHRDRHTVCVSSQVGCSLLCDFCATGELGYKRDLTALEIASQVLFFSRYIKENYKVEDRVTNVVFMGMGEPFLNYDNVMKAIYILNDENKFNIGARKISISTSGVIEGIKKLSNEKLQVNLALSLHAPDDELRSKLMPINKKHNIESVLRATDEYINKTSRQVMIEYLLMDGVNDDIGRAKKLAKLIQGKLYVVNLIACNPVKDYKPSPTRTIEKFTHILQREKIKTVQRYRFGTDISAACGQLAGKA